jgi:plastocyanin
MLRRFTIACLAVAWLGAARPAGAQPSARKTEEAIAQLQREVRELRQMLIQAMQIEQQRHDLLLKLIQSGGPGGTGAAPGPWVSPPGLPGSEPTPPAPQPRTGTISGTVKVQGAPAGQPVFVFVENAPGRAAGRPPTIEIVQKGKQFSPQVSVVPVGTRALFPNQDQVFHNAFSLSPGNLFDLSLKAGERGKPVVLSQPGRVEVYCDIHARMWAEVLVTRSAHVARVAADGSFSLPDVPVGERVVAAWTGGVAPVKRTVQLSGAGARADLALDVPARPRHNNKQGYPYDTYAE